MVFVITVTLLIIRMEAKFQDIEKKVLPKLAKIGEVQESFDI
jgi:hypothetical protein